MRDPKSEFRAMLKARETRPDPTADHAIIDRVIGHTWYQNAASVMLYLSVGHEVETDALLSHAWGAGKRVFVPRCFPDGIMDAIEIFGREDLQSGMYGIPEPKSHLKKGDPRALDLIVVPGVAFDRERNRLGRGKGYYDRFLAQSAQAKTIGICRNDRLFASIPVDTHDRKMDVVITENEIL